MTQHDEMTTEAQLREARALLQAGDEVDARDILVPLLRAEPDNLAAWQLYAVAASTRYYRHLALENILRLQPDHRAARRMLAELYAGDEDAPPTDHGPLAWAIHLCERCGARMAHPRGEALGACALCGGVTWQHDDENTLPQLFPGATRYAFAVNAEAARAALGLWRRRRLLGGGLVARLEREPLHAVYLPAWQWAGHVVVPWHGVEEDDPITERDTDAEGFVGQRPAPAGHRVEGTLDQAYHSGLWPGTQTHLRAPLVALLSQASRAEAQPLHGAEVLQTALYAPDVPAETHQAAAREGALARAADYLHSGRALHHLRFDPTWQDESAQLVLVPCYVWHGDDHQRAVLLVHGLTGQVAGRVQLHEAALWRWLFLGWGVLLALGVLGAWPSVGFGVVLGLVWAGLMLAWRRYVYVMTETE